MAKERHGFTIPVGDWSDDGHGKCEYYHASADKPFKDVCYAFKAAKELFKESGFTPERVCSEYQDSEISEEDVKFLASKGYKVDPDNFYTHEMANLVVWFLNQGDPKLKAKLTPEGKEPPMLRNWDYCKVMQVSTADEHENLDGFGYGLLGD